MGGGGGGDGRTWHHDHWLWPPPPPGDLEIVVAWPARGIPETRARLAGELIEEARGRIIEAWPGSRAPRASGVISFLDSAHEDDSPGLLSRRTAGSPG